MIAIVPTFCVAYFSNIQGNYFRYNIRSRISKNSNIQLKNQDLTGMNDVLNAVMSLQLPFAVIPTIAFTSSVAIMGEFVNGIGNKIVSVLLFILVITINITFVVDRLNAENLDWGFFILVGE